MIDSLLKNKSEIFIISPHFDDAILSCGSLILELRKHTSVTVVNVFTEATYGPYTLSARKFLQDSKSHVNAHELYKERAEEDSKVLNSLGVKVINLGLIDGLFRKKKSTSFLGKILPEYQHLYPTYYRHVLGKISEFDDSTTILKEKLRSIISKNSTVFAPFNISGHVDHLITRKATEDHYENIVYYSEFPYNFRKNDFGGKKSYKRYEINVNPAEKNLLISQYGTQISGLFKDKKIPDHKEIYFKKETVSIKTYTREDNIEKIMEEWLDLWKISEYSNNVNSPYWFKSISEEFNNKDYIIISLREKVKLVAVGALFRKKIYGIDCYTILPTDFICGNPFLIDWNNKTLVNEFINILEKLGIIYINNVPQEVVSRLKLSSNNIETIQESSNYYLSLQQDAQGKAILPNRSKLIKKVKNIEDQFELRSYRGYSPNIFSDVYKIDSQSRKQTRGYNTFSNNWSKKLFVSLAKNFDKYFSINLLFFENKPVAYEIGFIIGQNYFGNQLSFKEEFKRYTPGKVLIVRLIDWLTSLNIKTLDLGSGDSEIKKLLTNDFRHIHKIIMSQNFILRNYLKTIIKLRTSLFNLVYKSRTIYTLYRFFVNLFNKYL